MNSLIKLQDQKHDKSTNFKADPEVLYRFAVAFRDKTVLNKTQLHTYSKLRWDLHCKYVEWMVQKHYVKDQLAGNIKCYTLTESGMKMCNITAFFLGCLK